MTQARECTCAETFYRPADGGPERRIRHPRHSCEYVRVRNRAAREAEAAVMDRGGHLDVPRFMREVQRRVGAHYAGRRAQEG